MARRVFLRGVLLCAVGFCSGPLAAAPTNINEVESALGHALDTLKRGQMKQALAEIDKILAKNPNFRLGHLIKGDILMARAGRPSALSPANAVPEDLANLRLEAEVRLTHYFNAPPAGHLPSALLRLAPHHPYALLLDSEKSRLYVFKNAGGKPQHVANYYVTLGKLGFNKEREGDQRTPLGVYHVTSEIAGSKLTDFYGPGAFPINFPNEIDRRAGRTGSGIWIHGTPSNTYSRPPRASDGCIVLANADFADISRYVNPGSTPIVIAQKVVWKSPDAWRKEANEFMAAVESWQHDWDKRDSAALLSHYSDRFESRGRSLAEWMAYRRATSSTPRKKSRLDNLSVFAYPSIANSAPMMMVTFNQHIATHKSNAKKTQYWQLERGVWYIVHEAASA